MTIFGQLGVWNPETDIVTQTLSVWANNIIVTAQQTFVYSTVSFNGNIYVNCCMFWDWLDVDLANAANYTKNTYILNVPCAVVYRLKGLGSENICLQGFTPSDKTNGQLIVFVNRGTGKVTLQSSTGIANAGPFTFLTPGGKDFTLDSNGGVVLWYDPVSKGWRVLSDAGGFTGITPRMVDAFIDQDTCVITPICSTEQYINGRLQIPAPVSKCSPVIPDICEPPPVPPPAWWYQCPGPLIAQFLVPPDLSWIGPFLTQVAAAAAASVDPACVAPPACVACAPPSAFYLGQSNFGIAPNGPSSWTMDLAMPKCTAVILVVVFPANAPLPTVQIQGANPPTYMGSSTSGGNATPGVIVYGYYSATGFNGAIKLSSTTPFAVVPLLASCLTASPSVLSGVASAVGVWTVNGPTLTTATVAVAVAVSQDQNSNLTTISWNGNYTEMTGGTLNFGGQELNVTVAIAPVPASTLTPAANFINPVIDQNGIVALVSIG